MSFATSVALPLLRFILGAIAFAVRMPCWIIGAVLKGLCSYEALVFTFIRVTRTLAAALSLPPTGPTGQIPPGVQPCMGHIVHHPYMHRLLACGKANRLRPSSDRRPGSAPEGSRAAPSRCA